MVFLTQPSQPPQPDAPTLVYRDTHNIRLNWKNYLSKNSKALAKQRIEFTLQMEDQQKLQHGYLTQYSGPDTCYTISNLPRSSKFKFKVVLSTWTFKSWSSVLRMFLTLSVLLIAFSGDRICQEFPERGRSVQYPGQCAQTTHGAQMHWCLLQ